MTNKHINLGVLFLFSWRCVVRIHADSPLFWFELEVIYFCNFFWLVEYCVYWNGDRQIVEMVRIEGDISEYRD